MKFKFSFLALASLATVASAQQYHANNFDISVYRNYTDIPVNSRINRAAVKSEVNKQFPQWYVISDKLTGTFTDIFGDAISISGNDIVQKVNFCFNNQLKALGVNQQEWVETESTTTDHGSFASYKQYLNGHEVAFSYLKFRFTKDGKLSRIQMKAYTKPDNAAPVISGQTALQNATATLTGATVKQSEIANDWSWFPVPSHNGYELRPSYSFSVLGDNEGAPLELSGYVDATNGEVLYRSNAVKETLDMIVKGQVYKQNPLLPSSLEPLADLLVITNGVNNYTDDTGLFSDASLSAPIAATVSLEGKWSKTVNQQASNATPFMAVNISSSPFILTFDTVVPSSERMINAYYHVGVVHNFMKGYFPTLTKLDSPLLTNVDYTPTASTICNAFFTQGYGGNPPSINFAMATPGCNSFANTGDVIYHEYGHAINYAFYNTNGAGSMNNGALNEGYADVWALSITKDPILGKGTFTSGNIIRRYDQTPKVYPADIIGESHNDGEIIAGAWWDVAVNIGAVDTMTQIFTRTFSDLPDGADGTEGDIYHSVLISALMTDDDDNNLSNGTPHFQQILSAFAKHGIYLLLDAEVVHTDIANQPANTPVTINASINVSEPAFLQGLKIFYKERTTTNWDSLAMTSTGTTSFTANLPGYPEGSIIEYYFGVYDYTSLLNKYAPVQYNPTANVAANSLPYQFAVGYIKKMGEDFEGTLDPNWQIGIASDDATSGNWVVASPVASYINSEIVQTGADHTTNSATGKCLVTGNAASTLTPANNADVDKGVTTAITPIYDLTGFSDPVIEYFRWYGNDKGSNRENDYWEVSIKSASLSTWALKKIENTIKSDYSWRRRIFKVKDYLQGSYADQVQLRFVASDKIVSSLSNDGQSTVEAAVDDIFIYDKSSATAVADVNKTKAAVYPNPAGNELQITLAAGMNGTISLCDLTGKELMNMGMESSKTHYTIPTSKLANGTYFVVVKSSKSIQTTKVAVMH